MKKEYVTCPICGESDMPKEIEPDEECDQGYITCMNLNCGSNGGTNFEALRFANPEQESMRLANNMADAAGKVVGEEIKGACDPVSVFKISDALRELKECTIQFNKKRYLALIPVGKK